MANMYTHLVSFGLKEGIKPRDFFDPLMKLYNSLQKQGISILALSTATHDGTEIPNDNLHYFRMVFASQDDFKNYLEHPEHKAFEKMAVDKLVQIDTIKITNSTSAFRTPQEKPTQPDFRPRSNSLP